MLILVRVMHASADYSKQENRQAGVGFHVISCPIQPADFKVRCGKVSSQDGDYFQGQTCESYNTHGDVEHFPFICVQLDYPGQDNQELEIVG